MSITLSAGAAPRSAQEEVFGSWTETSGSSVMRESARSAMDSILVEVEGVGGAGD